MIMYIKIYNHGISTLCDFERVDIYCLLYYPNTIQSIRASTFIDSVRPFPTLFRCRLLKKSYSQFLSSCVTMDLETIKVYRLSAFCFCLFISWFGLSGWVAVSPSHLFCPHRFANFETKDAQLLFNLQSKLFPKDVYHKNCHILASPLRSLCPLKIEMGDWDHK